MNKQIKTILLHIGMTKTASTSLQSFLLKNLDAFSGLGIGYFIPSFNPYKRRGNAGFLMQSARKKTGYLLNDDQYKEYCKNKESFLNFATQFKTVLLSEELLWEQSFEKDGFWSAVKGTLNELLGEDVRVHVILYLRRQDEWCVSRWKEALWNPMNRAERGFKKYLSQLEEQGAMNYEIGLGRLEAVFGGENLSVRTYDNKKTREESVFLDFCKAAGIPWQKKYVIPERYLNSSLTMAAAEAFCKCITSRASTERSRQELLWAAKLFSEMHPEMTPTHPMNPEERREFLCRYKTSNNQVAKKYLHLDTLFPDEIEAYETYGQNDEKAEINAVILQKLAGIPRQTIELMRRKIREARSLSE